MDRELRKHAEEIIEYFDSSVRECIENSYSVEVWKKGLETAQEWLRLLDAENPSQDELLAFIGVVHANRYRTSMWFGFAEEAYDWVSSRGVPILPRNVFFKSDGLQSSNLIEMFKVPSLEHAQTLYSIFNQYSQEDPKSEVWSESLRITQEWLRLLKSQDNTDAEISELIKSSFEHFNKHQGTGLLFDTFIVMSYWCGSIGKADLVPKGFGALFKNETFGDP